MKVYYDKWGKNGKVENFKVENSETLKKGQYIFERASLSMFESQGHSITWNYPLDDLESVSFMFFVSGIKHFDADLPKLKKSEIMFGGCEQMKSFSGDLGSLTNGYQMFLNCINLTTFTSKLSQLKSGYGMFNGCKLNEESLRCIADNINNLVEKGLDRNNDDDWVYYVLGEENTIQKNGRGRIDIWCTSDVSQEVLIECGNKMVGKGWDVYFNNTKYEYDDGTSSYDISEANGYIPDTTREHNYKLFPSKEEAELYYGLTPIESK